MKSKGHGPSKASGDQREAVEGARGELRAPGWSCQGLFLSMTIVPVFQKWGGLSQVTSEVLSITSFTHLQKVTEGENPCVDRGQGEPAVQSLQNLLRELFLSAPQNAVSECSAERAHWSPEFGTRSRKAEQT